LKPREINLSIAYSFADETVACVRDPSRVSSEDIVADFFDFRSDDFYLQTGKPQKYTLLHSFIFNINNFPIQHYLNKVDGEIIVSDFGPILDGANIARPIWFTDQNVCEHLKDLSELLEQATQVISEATFQLLFGDRTFLFEFNKFLQPYIRQLRPEESPIIKELGVIERAIFPTWLKDAVFHRDKGRCQLCGLDLTNIMVPTKQRNYDHMVPLKASGTNDPSNIQLTCESCNKSKGANVKATRHLTYAYW
jgi:hypothetical protein